MKSAEEWSKELFEIAPENITDAQFQQIIQQIQLDAFKAGAMWAARVADNPPDYFTNAARFGPCEAATKIRIAASNLKQLPEVG